MKNYSLRNGFWKFMIAGTLLESGSLSSNGGDISRDETALKVASSATVYLKELPSCQYRFSHHRFYLDDGSPTTDRYVFAHSGSRFILKLLGEGDNVVRITSYDGKTYYYLDSDKNLFLTSQLSNCIERIANHLYITPVFNAYYRLHLGDMNHFAPPDLLQSSIWLGALLQNTQFTTARMEKDSAVFDFRHLGLNFDYHYKWTPSRGFPHHYRLLTGSGPHDIDEHWDVTKSVKLDKAGGGSVEIPSKITSKCAHTDGSFHRASFTIEMNEPSMEVFKVPPSDDFFRVPSSMANIIVDEDLGATVNRLSIEQK